MSDGELVGAVKAAMKDAMKARDKQRLGTIRLIQAEFKRVEVDERVAIDDDRALALLDKMVKQRRDSETQYRDAGREQLAAQEAAEIAVISEFLPARLGVDELAALVDETLQRTGASGMQDMGAVMADLKPRVAGRADMGAVSRLVKARLSA
jgi:uncharacterized protein YqeY